MRMAWIKHPPATTAMPPTNPSDNSVGGDDLDDKRMHHALGKSAQQGEAPYASRAVKVEQKQEQEQEKEKAAHDEGAAEKGVADKTEREQVEGIKEQLGQNQEQTPPSPHVAVKTEKTDQTSTATLPALHSTASVAEHQKSSNEQETAGRPGYGGFDVKKRLSNGRLLGTGQGRRHPNQDQARERTMEQAVKDAEDLMQGMRVWIKENRGK